MAQVLPSLSSAAIVMKNGAALRECSYLLEIDRMTRVLWVRNGPKQPETETVPKMSTGPFHPKK